MRSINKIMMLVALLAVSTIVYGQQKGDKTLLKTEVMAEKLGLDAKQKAALDKQLKEAAAERKAMVERLKALQEEMKRDAFVARQKREAELKEILTDEQWATYEKMKESQKGKLGKMRQKGEAERMKGPRRPGAKARRFRALKEEKKEGNDEN